MKYYPKDDMVFHKEEKEFFGAIEGIQLPYTGKVFPMSKGKYIYDTKYDEYVVIPQKKRCVHLESGQPLGVGRVYYLPRAMKIVIKNEQGQNENMFRLA